MNDSEIYLALHKSLKSYFHATLRKDWALAYQSSIDVVELAQKLEEIACDKNKTIKKPKKGVENVDPTEFSGNTSGIDGGDTTTA